MVLNTKQTTIAYRCPECGCIVRGAVGIFSLTADSIKLKCPCGGSELTIVYTRDKKVRITVPCFVCPSPHSYLISSGAFFERELFTLSCTFSGLDVCFIGSEEKIDEAVAKAEQELIEIAGEDALRQLTSSRGEEHHHINEQVIETIIYAMHELSEEGRIHCRCEDGEGDYELQYADESIFLVCKNCDAEYEINSGSVSAATAFLEADDITLR